MTNRTALVNLLASTVLLFLTACGSVQPTTVQPSAAPGRSVIESPNCPQRMVQPPGITVAVDYLDTFRLGGRDYVVAADVPRGTRVGMEVGRIRCMITSYQVDPSYQLHDGDATFLPVGTTVFSVRQVSNSDELVAIVDGRTVVYRALP